MRDQLALPVLLVLLCASTGWTQTTSFQSPNTQSYRCTQSEGTSLTVLMDAFLAYLDVSYYIEQTLTHLSKRFPCVTRQYTSILINYRETNETITADKGTFLKSITRNSWDDPSAYTNSYDALMSCNQSLLYGLKRALEVSPVESIILVYTAGSMLEYNNINLQSDITTLLKTKKSQVFFVWYPGYCSIDASQQNLFNDLSSVSFGEFINRNYLVYFKFINNLELLLSKPLNSSVRILDLTTNVTDTYTKSFNVTNSLSYLLIACDDTFTLNFTDQYGKTFSFQKMPYYMLYYYNQKYPDMLGYHLVKNPAAGTWTLSAQGIGSLTVRILGFTGLNISGKCSDSDCQPDATCGEFGGAQQCTCKEGFALNGSYCQDINECQDYFSHNCNYFSGIVHCKNTIGSYTCECFFGSEYKEGYGCVDIDECAVSSLNDCHPLAVCANGYYGHYTCTCPAGYYGDGRYCGVNECEQGMPCNVNEQCIKYNGSYSCADPCSKHIVLNEAWRSTSNVHNYNDYVNSYDWVHCDSALSGWYRLKGEFGQQMPDYCVPSYSCGTHAPMWLKGSHPTIADGIVNRTACANWGGDCCLWYNTISVKKCSGGYYVYKLFGTPTCSLSYCIESNSSCSGIDCAPDEECRSVNGGVQGCQCKNSSYISNGIQPGNLADYLKPQVVCGLEHIELRYSKCLLESLGYDTSSIHLRDSSCRGQINKKDKSYIVLFTRPIKGQCGGNVTYTKSDITYTNTVYLAAQSDGVIIRNEYPIDFHCSYPSDMEINLVTAIASFTASASINVAGTSNYTITMGLFQNSGYTSPYTGSEVWLDSSSMLYVGVIVTGSSGASQFVLLMKNCYATPTANDTYGIRYDIIKDRCPNKNDPTISVAENGMSLKGRFSLQIFKFLGGFDQVYLHCQVGLCDASSSDCSAWCPLMRSDVLDGMNNVNSFKLGPIRQKAASPSGAAALSSGGGTAVPTTKLFIAAIIFLLILY